MLDLLLVRSSTTNRLDVAAILQPARPPLHCVWLFRDHAASITRVTGAVHYLINRQYMVRTRYFPESGRNGVYWLVNRVRTTGARLTCRGSIRQY